jgi:hypothetical protein
MGRKRSLKPPLKVFRATGNEQVMVEDGLSKDIPRLPFEVWASDVHQEIAMTA